MSEQGVLRVMADNRLGFWCEGCKEMHVINVGHGRPSWDWNGSYEMPTFKPSVLIRSGHHVPGFKPGDSCWCTYNAENPGDPAPFECVVCHTFVTEGRIQYLDDCTHPLRGQTVDLKPPSEVRS